MKPHRRPLHLARETIRELTQRDLRQAVGGLRNTPVTPECPSEYTTCPNSCSD